MHFKGDVMSDFLFSMIFWGPMIPVGIASYTLFKLNTIRKKYGHYDDPGFALTLMSIFWPIGIGYFISKILGTMICNGILNMEQRKLEKIEEQNKIDRIAGEVIARRI
jgi:hypothetical protein